MLDLWLVIKKEGGVTEIVRVLHRPQAKWAWQTDYISKRFGNTMVQSATISGLIVNIASNNKGWSLAIKGMEVEYVRV